ncbi:unnamed protein product [Cunninghamella echinulata]
MKMKMIIKSGGNGKMAMKVINIIPKTYSNSNQGEEHSDDNHEGYECKDSEGKNGTENIPDKINEPVNPASSSQAPNANENVKADLTGGRNKAVSSSSLALSSGAKLIYNPTYKSSPAVSSFSHTNTATNANITASLVAVLSATATWLLA